MPRDKAMFLLIGKLTSIELLNHDINDIQFRGQFEFFGCHMLGSCDADIARNRGCCKGPGRVRDYVAIGGCIGCPVVMGYCAVPVVCFSVGPVVGASIIPVVGDGIVAVVGDSIIPVVGDSIGPVVGDCCTLSVLRFFCRLVCVTIKGSYRTREGVCSC